MANTKVGPISFILGSFSNDEGEGNENVKNAIVYKEKQQLCTRITFFLYISKWSLHDYGVKMCNCTIYGGRK